jgi:hypothetical protein
MLHSSASLENNDNLLALLGTQAAIRVSDANAELLSSLHNGLPEKINVHRAKHELSVFELSFGLKKNLI